MIAKTIIDDLHEDKAPNRAKSIQYVVEKNIHPWMLVRVSSFLSTRNHKRPDMRPRPRVWIQLRRDNIRGRVTVKLRRDKTYSKNQLVIFRSCLNLSLSIIYLELSPEGCRPLCRLVPVELGRWAVTSATSLSAVWRMALIIRPRRTSAIILFFSCYEIITNQIISFLFLLCKQPLEMYTLYLLILL